MMMPMLKVIGRIKKALDWYFFSLMVSLILGECESGPMAERMGFLHGPQNANVSIGDASQGSEEEGLGKRGREAETNTGNDWTSVSFRPRQQSWTHRTSASEPNHQDGLAAEPARVGDAAPHHGG